MQTIAEIVTVPPGDLVYHLVTLFAIQITLGIAFVHWNRHRSDVSAIRSLVASSAIIIGRLLLILIAFLGRLDVIAEANTLPPLERLIDVTTVAIVGWAFLPIAIWKRRLSTTLLMATFVLTVALYGLTAVFWARRVSAGLVYGQHWQGRTWSAIGAMVSGLLLVISLIWRGDNWSFFACLAAVWLGGFALSALLPTTTSHTAGWSRLANLVGLPLLSSLVYRRALAAPASASEDATLGEINLVSTIRRIEETHDIDSALRLTASAVAQAMSSDMVAIGLPSHDEERSLLVTALHPPTGVFLAPQKLTFSYSAYPILAKALKTRRAQYAHGPRQDRGTIALYRQLGFDASGPLLVQPLTADDALLGIMLIGNPFSQRRWLARDEQMARAIAGAIAGSLTNAGRSEAKADSAELARTRQEVLRLSELARRLEQQLDRERGRYARIAGRIRSIYARSQETGGAPSIDNPDLTRMLEELRSRSDTIGDHAKKLQSLLLEDVDESGRQLLQRIRVNTERLNKTLDDLGRLNVVEDEDIATPSERIDLAATLRSVVTEMTPRLEEQNLHVTLDVPNTMQSVKVDRTALRRLVADLLANAIGRSQLGSEIVITCSIERYRTDGERLPDYLLVSVSDRGLPISSNVRERIFQPSTAAKVEDGPEDVDLYKTKAIVQAHDGRIWVESSANSGTAFRFILPLTSDT